MTVYDSVVIRVATTVLLSSAIATAQGDRPAGAPFASRSPVLGQNGMAATSHPLASQIAIDILKAGGSAVDAAIAANAAIGLFEPTGNGIGGDLFAIVWDPMTKRVHGLNASGRAARGLSFAQFQARCGDRPKIPAFGPLPVTVPGCVSGWDELHRKFGKLPFADLMKPAIRYANDGFPVTEIIAYYWEMNLRRFDAHRADITELDNLLHTFAKGGRAPRHGEVFRNPDLGRTLAILAKEGPRAFYEGDLATTMAAYCKRVGCPLRREDFVTHGAEWVEPVSVDYRGHRVWELPPNGQGIAALQMLTILEGYDLRALGHNSIEYLHLHTEAKKLAFADRARFYADPVFAEIPIEGLLSRSYADERRKQIGERAARSVDPGNPALHDGDTIYLTVADKDGMMVSLIQSNYFGMGSGLMPDGLGFVLQDRGALFSLDPEHPNAYAPGKRPFHTIIPAFVSKGGEPFLSFGVMGGAMQPQGHVQILCNLIDFRMNLQAAGDAARYRHTGSTQPDGGPPMSNGGTLALESGIGLDVRAALEKRGHRVTVSGSFGGYQAVLWDATNRVYHGASEMRKDGTAIGY